MPPPKGYKQTEEHKKNRSLALLGHIISSETRKKISLKLKNNYNKGLWTGTYGWIPSTETKRKISKANTGRKLSEKTKRKLSETHSGRNHFRYGTKLSEELKEKISRGVTKTALRGNKHPFWKGGNRKYGIGWSKFLKYKIRRRDNFTCQMCGIKEEEYKRIHNENLSVNHIDYDVKNCSEYNLITLCRSCNSKLNKKIIQDVWKNIFTIKIKQLYGL